MPTFEIREGDGNNGCYHRGEVEAKDAFDAIRVASRTKMIYKPRDVVLSRDIDGDDQYACAASYVAPIYGDACRWIAEARLVEVAEQMTEKQRLQLLSSLTEYDRKQSTKPGYNRYALAHYCGALDRVKRYCDAGHPLRDAIATCFLGSLCNRLLKVVKLEPLTKDEFRFGLEKPLPYIE
jgi:hypothetical protein